MKPITVLHTIETSGPGGAENVLLTLALKLDPKRFRSIIVINDPGWLENRLNELSLHYYRVPSAHWYDFKLPRKLRQLIKAEGVDIIHSHLPDQNFWASIVGRLSGRPVIATYHGAVELNDSRHWRNVVKLTTVKRAATVISVVCGHVEKMLLEIGFPASKLRRIYNGIDLAKYTDKGDGRLRRELGLSPGAPIVGMVANIRATKGHEDFIRAARIVANRFPSATFVISGDPHKELAPPLYRLVEELGLKDRVVFLGFRSDVPMLLAEMDVFVLPSTSEGFPLVVLEAMAAGKPVVSTRCGGVEEVFTSDLDSLLVPVRDADAIAAQICSLLDNPQHTAAMGDAGRHRVRDAFSVESMIAEYEHLYEALVERGELASHANAGGTR